MAENTKNIQQEILSDAERKAERTLKRARREAQKLRDAAEKENEKLRERRLAEAEKSATAKARSIIAGIPYEERKIMLLTQEKVFDEVFKNAIQKFRDGEFEGDVAESLAILLSEVLQNMPECEVEIRVNPRGQETAKTVGKKLNLNGEVKIIADAKIVAGVEVISADGKLRYDNTVTTRLEREKDRLRSELASVLDGQENDS
ncbi:MAG: V-type ATP synthase subunit E [Lentisphaeria bacterium]